MSGEKKILNFFPRILNRPGGGVPPNFFEFFFTKSWKIYRYEKSEKNSSIGSALVFLLPYWVRGRTQGVQRGTNISVVYECFRGCKLQKQDNFFLSFLSKLCELFWRRLFVYGMIYILAFLEIGIFVSFFQFRFSLSYKIITNSFGSLMNQFVFSRYTDHFEGNKNVKLGSGRLFFSFLRPNIKKLKLFV